METRNDSIERSTQDLKALVREGQEVLKSGAHLLTEQAHATLEQALDAAQALKEKAREGAKATDRAIREHPYTSLGIALGVGVLIGCLIQRR